MLITPSLKKSLIVEQFQGNYLKYCSAEPQTVHSYIYTGILRQRLAGQRDFVESKENG